MHLSKSWLHAHRSLNEWLYVSLVLFVFGGYIVYSLFQERIRFEAQESERLTNQATVVAKNLSRQLNSTNLALASVLREIPDWRKQQNGAQLATEHMKALKDAMPGVLTMFLIDATGAILASDKPELVGQNVAHREYFKTVQSYPNPDTLYVSAQFLFYATEAERSESQCVYGNQLPLGG